MPYPQICQTCYYSGGLAPAEQFPEYTRPLFCRKPETITEKIWPHVWPIVESTYFCLNWRSQPTLLFHVTGELTPDITGDYIELGKVDFNKFLVHISKGYYVWFDEYHNEWLLTRPAPYGVTVSLWYRIGAVMLGDYLPRLLAAGTATLNAGPK